MARSVAVMPASSMPPGAGFNASPPSEVPKADLACLVCRSRKVRCDRTLPQCRNCIRLGVPCPGYDRDSESISRKDVVKSAENIFRAAGVEKRRVGSCEECRASKHRCTKTRPSCRRCHVRKLPCVYPIKSDRDDQSGASASDPRPGSPLRAGPEISPDFGVETAKLYSDTLPDDAALRLRLVNAYFERSYPLRCLGFVHKPSFMQSFDRASVVQDYGEPFLYAMCALGARHIYFDTATSSLPASTGPLEVPGQRWAERARKEILAEIHAPSIHHLMTMLLLCDYGLRADQNAMVFVIASFLYRTVRLLSLDNPDPLPNTASTAEVLQREIENRIVWACYFADIFVASGVEKNSCWKDYVPDIPLPCSVESFRSQTPSPPRYVQQLEDAGVVSVIQDLDLTSLTILVARLRFKVLRLIRTTDTHGDISDTSSPFLQIIQQIVAIYQNIPERYHLNDLNMYTLKDHHLLGAVFFLHLIINAVVFDLTRISLPGFNFPLAAAFERAPADFRLQCQEKCRFHAAQVSNMVRAGLLHGRTAFDDIFCTDAVLESSKIQIIYAATVDRSPPIVQTTRENLRTHFEFAEMINRGKEGPGQLTRTLLPLCMLFGFRDVSQEYMPPYNVDEEQAEVTGSADIEHLAQFTPFRRARNELKKAGIASSPRTLSSGQSTQSRPTQSSGHPPLVIGAGPVSSPKTLSSGQSTQSRPAQSSGQPPPIVEAGPIRNDYSLPTLRPVYPTLTQQQDMIVPQLLPSNSGQMTLPPGPMADGDIMMMQGQVDEYLRAADELSNYLSWDMTQLPSWVDFGDNLPPG